MLGSWGCTSGSWGAWAESWGVLKELLGRGILGGVMGGPGALLGRLAGSGDVLRALGASWVGFWGGHAPGSPGLHPHPTNEYKRRNVPLGSIGVLTHQRIARAHPKLTQDPPKLPMPPPLPFLQLVLQTPAVIHVGPSKPIASTTCRTVQDRSCRSPPRLEATGGRGSCAGSSSHESLYAARKNFRHLVASTAQLPYPPEYGCHSRELCAVLLGKEPVGARNGKRVSVKSCGREKFK